MEHFTPSEAPIHETQRLPVVPPGKIMGRNQELGQAFAQIRAGAGVLLHGPSGVGKSALAATIASAFTTFTGGVLWWSLDRDSLAQLIVRLGRAYNARTIVDAPEPVDIIPQAAELLSRKEKPLIVLDGTPDLDAVREFARKVAPGTPMIVTSPEGGPGPWIPFQLNALSEDDAVALFMQAARLPQVSNLMRADIQGVCNMLDGMPLSLVLAGRHIQNEGQTPGEFLGALTSTGVSHRPLGLHSIFHQLPDALQGMLLTIGSTFAGQASTALLEYLQLAPRETVVYVMDMLATRGLVYRLPGADSAGCYAVHEGIHQFALDWLRDTQRLDSSLQRVHEAVLAYVEQHTDDTREDRAALVAEMPNIMGLAAYASECGEIVTLQRLSGALEDAFVSTGSYGYEIRMIRSLIDKVLESEEVIEPETPVEEPVPEVFLSPIPEQPAEDDPLPDSMDADATVGEALLPGDAEPIPPVSPDMPLDYIDGVGVYDTIPVDILPAVPSGPAPVKAEDEAVLEDAASSDDLPFEDAAAGQPVVEDEPEAVPPYDLERDAAPSITINTALADLLEASAMARESGDRTTLAAALSMLGHRWMRDNRLQQAKGAFTEALDIYEDQQDTDGMLRVLEALAGLSLEDGDLEQAVVHATRAENLAAEEDTARHGHMLALLGDIRLELGESENAVETYSRALDVLQTAGDKVGQGVVKTKLGSVYLDQGDFAQASTLLGDALVIFDQTGRTNYKGRVLGSLGTAQGQLGNWDEAAVHHRDALAIAQDLNDVDEQERQLANLAYTAQALGDRAGMLVYYQAGLNLAFKSGRSDWLIRYLDVLGRMLMDDVNYVATAVSFMEAADALEPEQDERLRWLRRARRRLEHVQASGIEQIPPPDDIASWAADQANLPGQGAAQ
jgi:tetratricopeptide (TPR) repeat protein/energy-coupling factor transporter ATP-binding protein EcfA2